MKKQTQLVLSDVLAFLVLCMVLVLLGNYVASRPVVSCSNTSTKIPSAPPTSLVTAKDYLTQGDNDY